MKIMPLSNTHADLSGKHFLHPYFVSISNEGSGESAHIPSIQKRIISVLLSVFVKTCTKCLTFETYC